MPAGLDPTLSGLAYRSRSAVNMFGGMNKIKNRLERREMATMDGPVVGLAVADERLGSRREKATILSGGGRLPCEIVAIFQGRQACSKKKLALFGLFLDRGGIGIGRRFRDRSQGMREANGKIRLGVGRGWLVSHPQKDRGLGFSPGGFVHARSVAGLARLHAAAVDHHDGKWNRRDRGFCRGIHGSFAKRFSACPLLMDEFVADVFGKEFEGGVA